MRIDAHQHFWIFDAARDAWITGDMQRIRRDFMPQDLKPELLRAGMDGCIAVQADQSERETEFLVKLARENSFIKGVVGWANLSDPDVAERLEHFSTLQVVKGFRHILQGETDRRYLLRDEFKRGIAALKQHDFTYDILIHNDQLPYVAPLLAAFADQRFVIDHLAKPSVKTGELEAWKNEMLAIAQYPNVWCKVSGLITEGAWRGWLPDDFYPYIDVVVEAFGMHRLMFGSDWPVCLLAGTYAETLGLVEKYFQNFSASEKDAFFGGNAADFYRL